MSISPMSADQAKALVDARQIFESYEAATRRLNDLAGSLRWKTVNGNKYLVRGYTGGKTVSLGPYDKKTIELKDKFERDKTAATEARKNAVDSVSTNLPLGRSGSLAILSHLTEPNYVVHLLLFISDAFHL